MLHPVAVDLPIKFRVDLYDIFEQGEFSDLLDLNISFEIKQLNYQYVENNFLDIVLEDFDSPHLAHLLELLSLDYSELIKRINDQILGIIMMIFVSGGNSDPKFVIQDSYAPKSHTFRYILQN